MSDTSNLSHRRSSLLQHRVKVVLPRLVEAVPVPRVLAPIAAHLYACAVRRGLVPYRPVVFTTAGWDERYRDGAWEFLGSIREMARMAVLGGYLHRYGAGASILDVGCGTGLLRQYAEGTNFERYIGIDPVPAAIEQAQRRWEHDQRTAFLVADPLQFEHAPFDVIILSEILYMLADPAAVLDRAKHLLTLDGLLLVSIWGHPGDDYVWDLVERRFRLVDRVLVRNEGYERALRGWRVACFARS